MNSYRFQKKPVFQQYGTKNQQRVILILLIAFMIAAIILGILYSDSIIFKNKTIAQLESRINSNLVDAIGQVSRMAGSVQSNSAFKLGQIRQHVFAMENLNSISVSVRGESGRLIPQEALTAIYSVLDRYEVAVQTATGNVLELRTLLLTHLMSLQQVLTQEL